MYRLATRLNQREQEQETIWRPLLSSFFTTYSLWFDVSSQMQEFFVLENGFTDLEPETRILAHTPSLHDALSFATHGYSPSFLTEIERRRIIRGPIQGQVDDSKLPHNAYIVSFPPFDVIFCGHSK